MNTISSILVALGILSICKGKSILVEDPSDFLSSRFCKAEEDYVVRALGGSTSAMIGAIIIYCVSGIACLTAAKFIV